MNEFTTKAKRFEKAKEQLRKLKKSTICFHLNSRANYVNHLSSGWRGGFGLPPLISNGACKKRGQECKRQLVLSVNDKVELAKGQGRHSIRPKKKRERERGRERERERERECVFEKERERETQRKREK